MTQVAEVPPSEPSIPAEPETHGAQPPFDVAAEAADIVREADEQLAEVAAAVETSLGTEAADGAEDAGDSPITPDAAAPAPAAPPVEEKENGRKKKGPPVEIEIPARLLNVVGVAGKEDTRYQMAGVLVETRDVEGLVSAAATDGRRMIVAECNLGLFDGMAVVYVPRAVVLAAVRIAIARPQDDKSGAMVTIRRHGDDCHLTAHAGYGPAVFEWQMDSGQIFPPFRDVIPDFADSVGAGRIGITSELVSGTLRTLQRVVGKEPKVKVYLPPTADRPIGLESQDGDSIKALAVVMPTTIGDWADKPAAVKGDEKPADPNQQTLPAGETPAPADDESWRAVPLDTLTPKIKPGKLKKLKEAGLTTVGHIQDFSAEHGEWWTKRISGFGDSGHKQIGDAMEAFWAARQAESKEVKNVLTSDAPGESETQADPAGAAESGDDQNTAAHPSDDFAEDGIDNSTRETVAKIEQHLVIEVARRTSGPWLSGYWLSIGKLERSRPIGISPTFPNRAEAIADATAAVGGCIEAANGQISGKSQLAAAREVRAALATVSA